MVFIKPLIAFVVISVLLRYLSSTHRHPRSRGERRLQKEELQRWEGEGGNLPG